MQPRLGLLALSTLTLAASLAACKPGGQTTAPGDERRGSHAEQPIETKATPVVFASVGVPHANAITGIEVDATGTAALSRDLNGGVRLWPALDGSREPMVVPIRDPRQMSLAADGEGGWTLALLDAIGGVRLVGADDKGGMRPLATLPPTDPSTEVLVLPGGDRVLTVGADHIVRLYGRDGRELSKAEANGLRPSMLFLANETGGAPKVFAATVGEFDDKHQRFATEIVPITLGEDAIKLERVSQTLYLDGPPSSDNLALSPDGRTVVYVQRQRMGGATWLVLATQLDDGRQVSVDSQITTSAQVRFGLLPSGRVLVDDGTGMGRVINLADREVELQALRSSPTVNHTIVAFGGGKRLAPASNWLAVHDLAEDDLLYLGYTQVNVTDVGISPEGDRVAWALSDRVAIEPLGERSHGEVVEVPGTRAKSMRFVDFVDADTIVALDWAGGAQIIRWRDGELVDAVDIGSNVQLADLARRGDDGLLWVRTNLWQNPSVIRIEDGSFGGRYLTPGASHLSGPSTTGTGVDQWGVWAIDGTGKMWQFDFAQLEAGVDTKSVASLGETLEFGVPEQMVVDGEGRLFWVRTLGGRPGLYITDPEGAQPSADDPAPSPAGPSHADVAQNIERRMPVEANPKGSVTGADRQLELAAGFVTLLDLSPDGRRIAVVQQRDPGQVVTVYDTRTLKPLWAQPIPAAQALAWSDDGRKVAVPGQLGGGAVFDHEGSVDTARCGLQFEALRTPPLVQGFFNEISVCEL